MLLVHKRLPISRELLNLRHSNSFSTNIVWVMHSLN